MATDSTASDDDTPPPLPAKNRESDCTNLSDKDSLGLSDYSSPIIVNNIMVGDYFCFILCRICMDKYFFINIYIFCLHVQPLPIGPQENIRPPTPPPKKPPMKAPL